MYVFYTHLPLTPLSITGALCHLSTLKVGISAVTMPLTIFACLDLQH